MSTLREPIRSSLSISPALNERLEELAASGHGSKSEIFRKAIALFDLAVKAKSEKKSVGILDQHKQLETEIVGI